METVLSIALVVSGILLAIALGMILRNRRIHQACAGQNPLQDEVPQDPPVKASPEQALPVRELVPAGQVDGDLILESFGIGDLDFLRESMVVPQEDGSALVIGTKRQASSFGEVVARSGPAIARGARHASSVATAGFTAAEQTGYLVKLHPDSAAALRHLKPDAVKGANGYVQGVVRGKDGKFKHVVKLKSATTLKAVSSGAAVVSALAMQAQLDRIEKQLAQIQQSVAGLNERLDDSSDADRDALGMLFQETYSVAQKTGELTQKQWDQIATRIYDAKRLRSSSVKKLSRSVGELQRLSNGSVGERSSQLVGLRKSVDRSLFNLARDDRAVTQGQLLMLWHLETSRDPSLEAQVEEVEHGSQDRLRERKRLLEDLVEAASHLEVLEVRKRIKRKSVKGIRENAYGIDRSARKCLISKNDQASLSAGQGKPKGIVDANPR